jgi:hypothetical protein
MEKECQDFKSKYPTMHTELHQFGWQVVELCDLESDCCLSEEDAYKQIKNIWLQLKQSDPGMGEFSLPNE